MEFRLRPWPTFRYADPDFEIEKSVFLVQGENTVVVSYRNQRSRAPIELKLRPLLAFRDYNTLAERDEEVNLAVERSNGTLSVQPYDNLPRLYFYTKPDTVDTKTDWYRDFTYPVEEERGLDFQEDLFTPFELGFDEREPPVERHPGGTRVRPQGAFLRRCRVRIRLLPGAGRTT